MSGDEAKHKHTFLAQCPACDSRIEQKTRELEEYADRYEILPLDMYFEGVLVSELSHKALLAVCYRLWKMVENGGMRMFDARR